MKRSTVRWAVLIVITLVLIAWVSSTDGENAALARSFLRNLFRSL